MAELENYLSKSGIPTCKFINITPEEQNFKEGAVVLCSYKPEIRCTFVKYNDLARSECVLVDETKGFRFITETFNVILDMNELAKDQKRAKRISREIEKQEQEENKKETQI